MNEREVLGHSARPLQVSQALLPCLYPRSPHSTPAQRLLQVLAQRCQGPHGLLPFSEKSALGRRWELAAFQLVVLEVCSLGSTLTWPESAGEGGTSCWGPWALETPTYLNPVMGRILPTLILALGPSKDM